jgi:uncharacterized protein with HEPN domain
MIKKRIFQIMKKFNDSVYLHHILDAIQKIDTYLQGIGKDEFLTNSLIQDGTIRQLEIIGEATKQLSSELRDQQSSIPWSQMAGMRDKLIHHYFGVDLATVWLTATQDIPELRIPIQSLIDQLT